MRSRSSGAVVVVAAAALALPGTAGAHAQLVRSVPADRAVLANAPREARFVFDDDVTLASEIKAVRNEGGSVLAGKPRVVPGRTLVVPLRRNLAVGDYTVLWRVVSDDGHLLSGVISFAVGAGRAPPSPSLAAEGGPTARDVVARFLFLAGILVAGGGSLFRFAVGIGRERVLIVGFLLAFFGGTALLGGHASVSSRFGLAVAVATVVAALGATAAVISTVDARAVGAAWMLGLLLLPAPSFAGHALDPGRPRIEVLVDLLHIVAAAAWFGGLVQLAFVLRHDADAGRRFSVVAVGGVVGLAATGVARAFAELGAVSQVWTTGYGRLLIVKTGLLAVLVSLGWINRYRLLQRRPTTALGRTVRVELLLLTGLVVAVAILTDSRPGRDREALAALPQKAPAPPPKDAFVVAGQDGDRAVALAVEARRVRATVLGPTGSGVDGLDVTIAARPTASCGAGCYEAEVAPPRGRVSVSIGGRRLGLPIPARWPPQPAAQLIARATRTFERLSSVSYVEQLASGLRNGIVSTFTLEAPNRLSYRIHGGSSAIVIGERRWDRVRGGPWDETGYGETPQPTPIWEGPLSNAYVLARTSRGVTLTFLNRRVPAWFTVRLDRRTLLPRTLQMTAAAHFMHHRYFDLDAPRRIFPPKGGG